MRWQVIRQEFSEELATGAHGLLANPLADSVACAATSDDHGPSLQHSDMDIGLDVSMGPMYSDADAEGVTDDEVAVPSLHLQFPTRSYAPPARTTTRTDPCLTL